ncbi:MULTISPECIES: alkaline phosphatase D family protein [unclassified Micromonospora]|uniref:alkaline phosphatase D family protein n=1 Tax=unclassified Micromonospora TaxID=2617518 RepID=UPI0022B63784|nr:MULTISPECIES: alkaline phosphatase D family protein [unclassified Micromonospora]MCZ7418315.1 alkaline phosphatase D family protein [Verrucosispora sp. WMMA2121]WBB92030.1 alkaline phosphatase D family protein [Verrucosispora sp. WMMC514]
MSLSRRSILLSGLAAGAAGATGIAGGALPASAAPAPSRPPGRALAYPFTLGVASGDPDHEGFVLWTRLAPQPLAEDGLGGMPDRMVPVFWELAADERFRHVVRRGVVDAHAASAHSVHVELTGLLPGREYFYRFRVQRHLSPVGRTRTAPAPWSLPATLAMAFASCSQYEHGYFTAYRRLAETEPELVLHLGDYQYEYARDTYTAPGGNPRDHEGPETRTLANYRQRHAQYKTDPDLQAAHAVAPWAVVFDDHEVENNWADDVPEAPDPDFPARRAAAFRAYYENMPLRRTSLPRGVDMQLYRRLHWGRLATFHLLDTRQYRDDQACGDGYQSCPEAAEPSRSILGERQEAWLLDGFRRSSARWDLLAQQVFFAQRDRDSGPLTVTSMDAWDGYLASRDRITRGWLAAGVRNPVVLTGDVHAHWASDLKLDYADPTSRTVGSELVCSSITSGGDGADSATGTHPWLAWNPHLRFHNNLRGYVRTTLTGEQLTADFDVLPFVSSPGAPARTRARFVIEDRVPGLHLTRDDPPAAARAAGADVDAGQRTVETETVRP